MRRAKPSAYVSQTSEVAVSLSRGASAAPPFPYLRSILLRLSEMMRLFSSPAPKWIKRSGMCYTAQIGRY